MRFTPERLKLLGQASRPPLSNVHSPRSRGPSTTMGRLTWWFMQQRLKAGLPIEFTSSELSPDYLRERLPFRYDMARTGRTSSSGPNRSNLRREDLNFASGASGGWKVVHRASE